MSQAQWTREVLREDGCYAAALSSESGAVLNSSVKGALHNIWILIRVQFFKLKVFGPTASVLSNLVRSFMAEVQVE